MLKGFFLFIRGHVDAAGEPFWLVIWCETPLGAPRLGRHRAPLSVDWVLLCILLVLVLVFAGGG